MEELHRTMKMHLEQAQSCYKEIADVKRKKHPSFQVGYKVWLLCRNIKTNRPCDKLDYQRNGPFRIENQINTMAYRLELPASMKIHLVFHASLLEIYHESTISGRSQPTPPFVEINGYDEYEVKSILDSRIRRGKLGTLYTGEVIQSVSVLGNQFQISTMHQRRSEYFSINIRCNLVQIIDSIHKRSNSLKDLGARKRGDVIDTIRTGLS